MCGTTTSRGRTGHSTYKRPIPSRCLRREATLIGYVRRFSDAICSADSSMNTRAPPREIRVNAPHALIREKGQPWHTRDFLSLRAVPLSTPVTGQVCRRFRENHPAAVSPVCAFSTATENSENSVSARAFSTASEKSGNSDASPELKSARGLHRLRRRRRPSPRFGWLAPPGQPTKRRAKRRRPRRL
jgi:hypothetical protein